MLKGRLPLIVSLVLLLAIGAVGWQMNRAAQRTAESIHLRDSKALVQNNAALASRYLELSAKELADFTTSRTFALRAGSRADQELLKGFRAKAVFFPYGAALTDVTGAVLTFDAQEPGLPPPSDPGYARLWQQAKAGEPGYSSIMKVQGVPLAAVAVPVVLGGQVKAFFLAYTKIATSQLQAYLSQLGGVGEVGAILDAEGVFAAVSDTDRLGAVVEPEVRAAITQAVAMQPKVVEYTSNGQQMIAFVTTGMPGGWTSFKSQTVAVFYGRIRSRNLATNLALLVLILVAGAALSGMNYRAERVRRRSEERFRALVQNAMDVVTVLRAGGEITYDSPSITTMLGFGPADRIGVRALATVHPDDREHTRATLAAALREPATIQRAECRLRRADGSYLWADLSVSNLLDNPAIRGIVVNARDISESRRLQEQMSHQALHDSLTGLPNRRLFNERLSATLRVDGHGRRMLALVFVDLDNFKPVNDRLGHDAGDELLCQVTRRFQPCLRSIDTFARVGGDEFVILLDRLTSTDDATEVASRLVATFREPFWIFGEWVRVGASLGVTVAYNGENPAEVLRRADVAMYNAKQAGGLRYELAAAASSV